jgi:hypothetical protein
MCSPKSSNFSEDYKLLTILGDKNGNIQVVWGVVLCFFLQVVTYNFEGPGVA